MENKELWFLPPNKTLSFRKKLKIQLWRFTNVLLFQPSWHLLSGWRIFLLRIFGAKIGKGCFISPKVIIHHPWNLEVGNYSAIDDYTCIKNDGKVSIGDFCSLARYIHIYAGSHDVKSRSFMAIPLQVNIKDGCFIASGVTIAGGVTIGTMSVVYANSFVVRNLPDNMICIGYPCKPINKRLNDEEFKRYRYTVLSN